MPTSHSVWERFGTSATEHLSRGRGVQEVRLNELCAEGVAGGQAVGSDHSDVECVHRVQGDHGAAKVGGASPATQAVSGAAGSARKETITRWAQGDWGETKCPTSGCAASR